MDYTAGVRLDGQVALVTGGGRGIGRAIAERLAAAGAAVAVVARSEDQLADAVHAIEAGGGKAVAVVADVSAPAAVERAHAHVERALGPVDVLVNNAGVLAPLGPSWAVEADAWWRTLEVNLRGSFLCSTAVLPAMVKRGRGRIINVASDAGLRAIAYCSAYAVSKAALIRLSENLAAETGEHGIAVFSIGPDLVRTAMTEMILNTGEGQRWLDWFPQAVEEWEAPPDRTAELVALLASGAADSLSGTHLSVLDDVEKLAAQASEIRRADRYKLRLVQDETIGQSKPGVASS